MAFTPPPPAPSTADKATFPSRADAMVAWFATFIAEAGLTVSELNDVATGIIAQLNAVLADIDTATSVTSLTPSPGVKTLDTQPGLSYRKGMWVKIARDADPAGTWLYGTVNSYSPVTGQMVVVVSHFQGTGPFMDWTISLSGPRGADGNITAGKALLFALIFGD